MQILTNFLVSISLTSQSWLRAGVPLNQAVVFRPNPLDDECWFCIDCIVLQSTKINNNTARDVLIERIWSKFLSLHLIDYACSLPVRRARRASSGRRPSGWWAAWAWPIACRTRTAASGSQSSSRSCCTQSPAKITRTLMVTPGNKWPQLGHT